MSTRATYEFRNQHEKYTVYKHHDGFPGRGLRWIEKALELAWTLPRFEPCEFAAAFIAANKHCSGDVYLSNGAECHSDTEYHYVVSASANEDLYVEIHRPEGKLLDEGLLTDLLKKYCK